MRRKRLFNVFLFHKFVFFSFWKIPLWMKEFFSSRALSHEEQQAICSVNHDDPTPIFLKNGIKSGANGSPKYYD